MITIDHKCFDELHRISREIKEHEAAIKQLKDAADEIPYALVDRTDIDWREAFLVLFINKTLVSPVIIKNILGLRPNAEPRHVFKRLGFDLESICIDCGQPFTVTSFSRDELLSGWRSRLCDSCREKQRYARLNEVEEKRRITAEERQRQIDALKSIPYSEYLTTEHWKDTRRKALERAGRRCQLCGSQYELQVHHNTYENRGNEQPQDLIVLCRSCHSRHHEKTTVRLGDIQGQS
jgi:5-methylcytosine-specific restriction endonuclease McrA